MNKKTRDAALVAFSLLATSVVAQAGPGSSGGGDTEISSPEAVRGSATMAALMLFDLLKENELVPLRSSKANSIAHTIRDKLGLRKLNNDSAYEFRTECKDVDGNAHSGGAVIGDTQNPFCLSLPELQKLPVSELQTQLIALMGHEMAHQAGYEEEDAKLFQKDLLRVARNFTIKALIFRLSEDTLDLLKEEIELIETNTSIEKICGAAGTIVANIETLQHLGGAMSVPLPLSVMTEDEKNEFQLGLSFYNVNIGDTREYCGLPSRNYAIVLGKVFPTPPLKPIAKGDNQALKSSLMEAADALGKILPLLTL